MPYPRSRSSACRAGTLSSAYPSRPSAGLLCAVILGRAPYRRGFGPFLFPERFVQSDAPTHLVPVRGNYRGVGIHPSVGPSPRPGWNVVSLSVIVQPGPFLFVPFDRLRRPPWAQIGNHKKGQPIRLSVRPFDYYRPGGFSHLTSTHLQLHPGLFSSARTLPMMRSAPVLTFRSLRVLDRGDGTAASPPYSSPKKAAPPGALLRP